MRDDHWDNYGPLLTTQNIADILGLTPGAILLRMHRGTIPAHHIGRSWVIFTAEVKQQIQGQPVQVDVLAGYPDPLQSNDLVRLLGKDRLTINRWLREGTIPSYRPATRYLVSKAQLRVVLRTPQGTTGSGSWLDRTLAELAAEGPN